MMKKQSITAFVAAGCLLLTASCSKDAVDDTLSPIDEATHSLLSVTTRAADDATAVSYPLRVYVFSADDQCVAMPTLANASSALSIDLPEGKYDLYAVGQADTARYSLPSKDEATTTSAITLKKGKTLGDLMMAHSAVTLSDGEANAVTLTMERKVMMLTGISIKKLPVKTKAVTVTLSPLYTDVLLDGTYQGQTGSHSVTLQKDTTDNRTWYAAGQQFLMPSVDKPTVTIQATIGDSIHSYTVTATEAMSANQKINFSGTYAEQIVVTLSGTVSGVSWSPEKTISFDFDDEGSTTEAADSTGTGGNGSDDNGSGDSGSATSSLPQVGTLYQGCYVIASHDSTITVLSSKEAAPRTVVKSSNTCLSDITTALASWGVTGISDSLWRLPSLTEAKYISVNHELINSVIAEPKLTTTATTGCYYYLADSGIVGRMEIASGTANVTPTHQGGTFYLRPVADIVVK